MCNEASMEKDIYTKQRSREILPIDNDDTSPKNFQNESQRTSQTEQDCFPNRGISF